MRTKTHGLPDKDLTIQGLHGINKVDGRFWYLKALCELSSFRQKRVNEK